MTISNAQYTAWLAADNKERTVLAEVQAYSGGAVVTRYLSNRGFVSTASDTPASTAYDDLLIAVPAIRSAMADVFRGRSLVSFGDLVIDNSEGVRDSWLLDAWDGRTVRLYLGDAAWPKADYRLVFSGAIDDIQASDSNTITLRIRDRQLLLDVPLQVNRIGGTGTTKDQRQPACYGQVLNIAPVLIDAATRKYQFHDGPVQSIDAVYQDGVSIATYTPDLSTGTFVLTAALSGRITCDVKGSKTGAVYINTTADIAKRIVTERSTLTASDIDATAITALNTDAPGAVGIYIADDSATVLSTLDALIIGAGGYYCINRAGLLTMSLFKGAAGTPAITLTDDDIELAGIDLVNRIVPVKSVRLGYARYYATQQSAAASLTEAQRQRLLNPYLVAYAATGATGYLLAVDDDLAPTCYLSSTDAATEATRRAALWGSLRRVFRLRSFLAAQQVKLGDTITLNLSRYGLGAANAVVVGLRESLTAASVELEVFL